MANYLKKIVVGGQTYDLKDGSSRRALCAMLGLADDAALDAWAGQQLGSLAWETYSITTSVRDSGDALDTALPTEAAVRDALADIVGAMHFIGVSTTDPATGIITIDGQVYSNPQNGDIVIYQDSEYVFVENQQHENEWHKLGDENLYVKKTDSIAGITYGENSGVITKDALATALELGTFAFTNTVTTNVAAQSITNAVGETTYTPAGTIEVGNFTYTSTVVSSTGDYTPEGEISLTVYANNQHDDPIVLVGGAVDVDVTDVTTTATLTANDVTTVVSVSGLTYDALTSVELVANDHDLPGFTVTGIVEAPTISVSASTDTFVKDITFTAATFTQTNYDAAVEGVTVAVGSGNDSETLFFYSAATNSVSAISAWNAGNVSVNSTGAAVSDTPTVTSTSPTFIGCYVGLSTTGSTVVYGISTETDTVNNITAVSYDKPTINGASFTGATGTIEAQFTGTQATVTVSGNYDKLTGATASFAGTQATITVPVSTFTVPGQTVTVTAPAHTYNA